MNIINFKSLDPHITTLIAKIGVLADKKKLNTYIVGGLVRDCLLHRKSIDCDIVVEGNALILAKLFSKQLQAQCVIHQKFKTAVVTLPNGLIVDFVSARRETYATSGALPDIEISVIADDLFRRDFTMNAMACSINKKSFGHIFDPFRGRDDLKDKQVRVMHSNSFLDDPTRMLRAVRYEARLGFLMEEGTLKLFKNAALNRYWQSVKPQRYFAEFSKIFYESSCEEALLRLQQLNALKLPFLQLRLTPARLYDMKQALKAMSLCGVEKKDLLVLWLMRLQDTLRKDDLQFILNHLGITREQIESVVEALDIDMLLGALSIKHISAYAVYKRLRLKDNPVLCMAFARARGLAKKRIHQFILKHKEFQLAITGDDIKKLGVCEGIAIKKVIDHVMEFCINHKACSKKEQLKLASEFIGE